MSDQEKISELRKRADLYESGRFQWNIRRVPQKLTITDEQGKQVKIEHPALHHGIFVVHGIGTQQWTETAATLHSGFEDALEAIAEWQAKNNLANKAEAIIESLLPPPFVYEGYWGDYGNVAKTFPDDFKRFGRLEKSFFTEVWKKRAVSSFRTFIWFLRQQLRLLSLRTLKKVGFLTWLLYIPLQIVAFVVLVGALIRSPKIMTGFLNDVRLYLDPSGVVEKAIVQRIDQRVAERFMLMIGLDLDFRPLQKGSMLRASGKEIRFDRVVWVAHSLGTVISYNVLSDLFSKSEELRNVWDTEQQKGVEIFKNALARFVTLGSPLDKVAFLFEKQALKPWPTVDSTRLSAGRDETIVRKKLEENEFWVNFHHVLDPVSGTLENPLIVGNKPPINIHARTFSLPGLAHVVYWKDLATLRFILGRTYGKKVLEDKELEPLPLSHLRLFSLCANFVWAVLLIASIWALFAWGPDIVRWIFS